MIKNNKNQQNNFKKRKKIEDDDDDEKKLKKNDKEEKQEEEEEEEEEDNKKFKKNNQNKKINNENQDIRQRIIKLLKEALGEKKNENDLEPEKLSIEIEEELFKLFNGVTKEYKNKYRTISFNLKDPKNPDLRESVLSGQITPTKLCSMTTQEMASEEMKKLRQKITQYHLEAAKASVPNQTSTDMFKCSKCGKRETTYYQMQTRSADEPMTTFHTCTSCGYRWKS